MKNKNDIADQATAQPQPEPQPQPAPKNFFTDFDQSLGIKRLAFAVLAAIFFVIVLHFSSLRSYIDDLEQLRQFFERGHVFPEFSFVLLTALFITLGMPRLLMCALAAALFGFWKGLLIAQTGALLGAYLVFRGIRWVGLPWLQRHKARFPLIEKVMRQNPSFLFIIMIRQAPLPSFVVNASLGLGPISSSSFLLGSFIGWLPQNVIVALAGDALMEEQLAESITQLVPSILLLGCLFVWFKWKKKKKYAPESNSII